MSLNTTNSRISYTGNGSTTGFAFPYYFLANEDLVVIQKDTVTGVETLKVLTTDYTVSGALVDSGGTVTMLVAPPTGTTLTIYRDPAAVQPVDLVENDSLPAEVQEQEFDRLTMLCQRLKDRVDRSIRLSEGFATNFSLSLPTLLPANAALVVNPTGDAFIAGPDVTDIADAAANAAAAAASAADAASDASAAASSAADAEAAAASVPTASVFMQDVLLSTDAADARDKLNTPDATETLSNKTIRREDNVLFFDSPRTADNYSLSITVGSNALTAALKDKAGSNPSSTSKCYLAFRSATITSGLSVFRTVAAALSVVIPNGTTIGMARSTDKYFVFVYAIDNAGTVEMALSLCHLDEGLLYNTVAISGGADGAELYSTTARTGVAIRLLGRFVISESSAGVWATAPSSIALPPFAKSPCIAIAATNTGPAITSTAVVINFGNRTIDTHARLNVFSSGSFVAPYDAFFEVSLYLNTGTVSASGAQNLSAFILVNGVGIYTMYAPTYTAAPTNTAPVLTTTRVLKLLKGDSMQITVSNTNSTTLVDGSSIEIREVGGVAA